MKRMSDLGYLAVAMLGWAGVGAYGVWEMWGEEAGDGWERPYALFSIALLAAVAFSVVAAWICTRATARPGLRRVGLGLGVLAVVSSLVAWATPLWATLLAISCIVFAASAPRMLRTGIAVLAAAQLIGIGVMIAAIEAELGRRDSYGDYPAAFGLGNAVIAAGSVLGVAMLARAGSAARSEPARVVRRDAPATA